MAELRVKMSCKDFDSYDAFLKRLVKNGKYYILKNDCMICMKDKQFVGRHIVQDPLHYLYIDNSECFLVDGIYIFEDLNNLIDIFNDIKENKGQLRKSIEFYRNQRELGFIFGSYVVPIGQLFTDEPDENLRQLDASLSWFNNMVNPVENMVDNTWYELNQDTLIAIRDGALIDVRQKVGDTNISTRIAKSLFIMAGISRMGTPISQSAQYTFLPSNESNIMIFEIWAKYKCGQSTKIVLNCIHEYLALIYDEEND